MRTVTLLQLRTDIAYQADIVTGTTGRYTTAMLNRFINQSIQRFRERISNEGIQHYLVSASGTIAAGASSGVPFATLDLSSLSPSLVRTYGLDITYQNVAYTLTHRPFTERAIWSGPQVTGMPQSWAHFRTDQLAVTPAPDQAYPYTVWYLPLLADLSSDSDTFDGVAGWEDFIVWDVTCRVINRDQYANAYAIAVAERDRVWEDILRSATKVSAAGGAVVGRDTFNDTSKRFPIRRIQPGGGGLPSDGTITNAMLATMSPSRIKGRAADAGVGAVQDLTPAQVAAIVPVFSGAAAGLVPTGTGSSTDALRGDGTWAPVSGGGGGGGGPTMLAAGPTGAVQYNSGSGFAGSSGFTFDGLTLQNGLIGYTPTGIVYSGFGLNGALNQFGHGTIGVGVNVLRGMTASGVMAHVLRHGTEQNQHEWGSTITTDKQRWNAVSSGLHRWFVGADFAYLDASQYRLATGMKLAVTQHAATGLDRLAGWSASGFATVATGVKITGSGVGLDLVGLNVASLSAPIFGARPGLVPTSSSAGMFLRDDGTWQTVTGGGGGGGGTVGAPTLSFQFNNGSGIQAGATGVKVAGSGVGINAVALTVASLSAPIFSGTQAGLVPTATSAGLFLRDDATWAGIPSNIATGIGVSQMLPAPPLTFRGRITLGSGPLEDVTVRQAASMLPLFAASGVGQGLLAAPTGGVSGKWLRDDGTWQAIPTSAATGVGAGPTMLAAGASGQLQYNGGSGFAGATGLGVIGGGLGLNAVGITVASLSAPVFGARAGLVPTSSSAGLFLKDDGTWATPAGGGGGGGSPGAPTNAIQYNAGSGVFGGATGFQYFVGSGMVAWEGARFPSGMLAFGGTGTSQVPQLYMGNPSGGGFFFALGNPALETIRIAERTASPNLVTYVRDQGGIGTPRVVEAIDRNPSGSVDRYFGDFNDVRDTLRRTNRLLQDQITVPTGRYQLQIGPNLAPAKSSWAHGHVWNASGTPAAQLNQERLSAQGLGLYSQAFATGLGDALAGWTSSGFANSATGFSIVGSGLGLQGVGLTVASLSAPLFAGSRAGLVPTASSAGLFLKDDGSWASPTVGGSVTGVSNAQLAQSPPFTLKGNASGVTGTVQDLTTQQVASLLGLVSIPSSTPAGLFLRDDGVFAGVPSNIPTGIGPSQMLPMPPLTFRARLTTGSGVPENITNFQAASMLPLFTASGTSMGLVYGPTGGTTGKFLKDDGTWATPAAGSASGIANNQLLPMPPLTIKGNNTGASAAPSDLTRGQVASLIGPFYGTGGSPGLVTTPTGGASGLFLKDNGSWEDLRRNIIQDGNIGSGVTVGSATIDFNQGQYHSATIFGQPQFNIRPPSGIHRHVQLSWTVGASGLKPTFFGTMVKWMGGSGNVPSWNTASGGVNFVTFFHDGTYMWANGADWGTTF